MRTREFQNELSLPLSPANLDAIAPPWRHFGIVTHRWLALPDVKRIFNYRAEALQQRFAP